MGQGLAQAQAWAWACLSLLLQDFHDLSSGDPVGCWGSLPDDPKIVQSIIKVLLKCTRNIGGREENGHRFPVSVCSQRSAQMSQLVGGSAFRSSGYAVFVFFLYIYIIYMHVLLIVDDS